MLSALLIIALGLPTSSAFALRPIQEGKGQSGLEEALRPTPSGLEEEKFSDPVALAQHLLSQTELPDSFGGVVQEYGRSGRLVDEAGTSLKINSQTPFLLMASALDHYFESTGETPMLSALRTAIPSPTAGETESSALRKLLKRGKPAEVSWNELAYLASVAHAGYASLNQQLFQQGGSALGHYFGSTGETPTLSALQAAIPSPEIGETESSALRKLLERGKPAEVSWNELAYLASVAHAGYGSLDQRSLQQRGSTLDHLGEEPTESRPAQSYARKRGLALRKLAERPGEAGYYSQLETGKQPSFEGLALYFLKLALADQLPKSPQGPKRFAVDGTPLVGLAPRTYWNYLPMLAYELFRPWLAERGVEVPKEEESAAGLEENPGQVLIRQAEDVIRRAGEEPAQSALLGEIRRDIQALSTLSAASPIYPTHLQVAAQVLSSLRDPQDYATGLRFLTELAMADSGQNWTAFQARLQNEVIPNMAIGLWKSIPDSSYQAASLVALPALFQGFTVTSGEEAARRSRRLVREGRTHWMLNVWQADPRTLWQDRNSPLRSKVIAELASRLGANHVEVRIPSAEGRQALSRHASVKPWQITLSRVTSDYLTEDPAVKRKGRSPEDAYRAVTRALMIALFLRVYDFHRYNLGDLKDQPRYRTMWYDSEQGLHPDLGNIDALTVAMLSHFFTVREGGRTSTPVVRPEEFLFILSSEEIRDAIVEIEQADLDGIMREILTAFPADFSKAFSAEQTLMNDYLPRLKQWQASFRRDADRFFRLAFYYLKYPHELESQRQRLMSGPGNVEVFPDLLLAQVERDPAFQPIRGALNSVVPSGLEERQAAWRAASELMGGFRSRSTVDSRPVVVIGRDLAQRIPGLQVLSGLEERVVIDRADLSDTLARAAQIGDTVYFYGDPQRGAGLEELAGRSGLSLSFVLRNPEGDSKAALVLRQIFEDLGVPSADISSGLEEFTRRVETLGLAA